MSDYSYWHDALKGKFGPMHDGSPQAGFYRRKVKGGIDEPVAIWFEGDVALAVSGGKAIEADKIWTWVCRSPITEELYRTMAERSGSWPDAIEELIGSNNPPADEAAADVITSAIDAALAALKNPVASQSDCDKLANHRDRLSKMWKAQDEDRKKQKQPHMDEAKAVDEIYKPILARIEEAGSKVKKAITAWLLKEDQKRREEAAKQAATGGEIKPVEPPKAGTTGHVTALRTFKSAVINDFAKALAHFADNAEVKELIQTLADRCARTDIAVPGCEIKTDRRAA